jgi:hypothetical protein
VKVQTLIIHKQTNETEESANEFFESKVGGAKKLAENKVDIHVLK